MQSGFIKRDTQGSGASILVVEDQRLIAADIAIQLKSFGFRVVGFATSGAEAIAKARELSPDVVLMDINLEGEMDGTEAARQIRANASCAIVFLTAFSDVETLERAKLAEPGGYVIKPASPVELRCAVEVALYKQQSEQRRQEEEARTFNAQLERVRSRVGELEHAYKELETFGASLTHDLRNPLQVITGAAEMLERTQRDRLNEAGRMFLGQVGSAADRMMEQLESLLDLARANRAELRLTEVDLSQLTLEVWREQAPNAPRAACTVADGMSVYADHAMLRRVMENLLSNAVKFSAVRKNPVIEVGFSREPTETCYFVRDNGVGFSMELASSRLFKPYGRLHPVQEFPGSGLGLSGAKRIVERHGGRMWAHGVPDVGATVFFTLPSLPSPER